MAAVPLALVGVLGAMAAFLLASSGRELVRWWRLSRVRPASALDLQEVSGRVPVSGVARRADEVLAAPLTEGECPAYDWRAMAMVSTRGLDGSVDRRLTMVDRGRDAVPFVVDDGTAEVLVDPAGAEFRLAESVVPDPPRMPAMDPDPGLLGALLQAGEHGPRRH